MYKKFFGLRTNPFGINPDPRFLWMTPHTKEVLTCLDYGIRTRKGFIVLTGEVGTGKTTLLKTLLSSLSNSHVATAFVFNPRMEFSDLLYLVMTDFGIEVKSSTKSQMLLQLYHWLLQRRVAGLTAALIIDEAQSLSLELLEEIRLLTNLETDTEKLLQIVLSGQPELEAKLKLPETRQLRQRIALLCRTRPVASADCRAYIEARLRIAGAADSVGPVFSSGAIEAIFRYSQGIPRIINLLCEHALVAAYADQLRPIPPVIIHEIATEFTLDELAPALTGDPHMPSPQTQTAANGQMSKEMHK